MRLTTFLMIFIFLSNSAFAVEKLGVEQTQAQLQSGKITLIDIRRPDEWAATGIAKGAKPLDMTSPTFVSDLTAMIKANPGKKVALICQAGARSDNLSQALEQAGFKDVVDVLGGTSAWIDAGLPTSKP